MFDPRETIGLDEREAGEIREWLREAIKKPPTSRLKQKEPRRGVCLAATSLDGSKISKLRNPSLSL